MANGFNMGLIGRVQSGIGNVNMGSMSPMKMDSLGETQSSSFKDVVSGLAGGLNQELNAPDRLLKSSMSGDSNVDISDVMTAMAKAEINVSVATQVTSKVIQAYDKIMQISV